MKLTFCLTQGCTIGNIRANLKGLSTENEYVFRCVMFFMPQAEDLFKILLFLTPSVRVLLYVH